MLRILLTALSLCIAAGTAAQPPSDAPKKPAVAKQAAKPKPNVRPAWAELTAEQQQILAPLKPDWDTLDPERRQKWIGIAKRYPRMKAQEQERVQRRMQAWARLTPEAVYVSALTGLAELLLSGCTTASDHLYLFPNGAQLEGPAPSLGRVPGALAARAPEPGSPRLDRPAPPEALA